MKHTQKGFTLVELLVVIAILAILATVSVVGYTAYINKANDSVAMQEAQPYKQFIENELSFNGDLVIGNIGTTTLTAKKGDDGIYIQASAAVTDDATVTITLGDDEYVGTFKVKADGTKSYLEYVTKNEKGTYRLFEIKNPTT